MARAKAGRPEHNSHGRHSEAPKERIQIGAAEKWPDLLMSVTEDQKRGLPHLHGVLGHSARIEKGYAKAFLDALPELSRRQGLGSRIATGPWSDRQSKYEAGRLRDYIRSRRATWQKTAMGLSSLPLPTRRANLLRGTLAHPLSGLTMTIARLCRRVWASRHGYCGPAKDDIRTGNARPAVPRACRPSRQLSVTDEPREVLRALVTAPCRC